MGYRNNVNAHARGVLVKPPHIPDYHLMVGSAEDLESKPLVVHKKAYPTVATESIKIAQNMTDAEMQERLANDTLEVNDFMENTLLIGSGL